MFAGQNQQHQQGQQQQQQQQHSSSSSSSRGISSSSSSSSSRGSSSRAAATTLTAAAWWQCSSYLYSFLRTFINVAFPARLLIEMSWKWSLNICGTIPVESPDQTVWVGDFMRDNSSRTQNTQRYYPSVRRIIQHRRPTYCIMQHQTPVFILSIVGHRHKVL